MAKARKKDINILLLGEARAGKSTFVNVFYSYLKYDVLENAMKEKPIILIPGKFKIMDENYQLQVVKIGGVKDELKETGVSETQNTKSYVFTIKERNVNVRLINTPAITGRLGIEFDNGSFENILDFIGGFEHLNAICVLLESNSIVHIEYCIEQLLLKLGKPVGKNFIFIFTKSRRTDNDPGKILHSLQKTFDTIQYEQNIQIPLHAHNIFFFDNESFRCLAAHHNGIKFSYRHMRNYVESWRRSSLECWRLIDYITGTQDTLSLEPYLLTNEITINEARRLIVYLFQPLAEIVQLSQDNITSLEQRKNALQSIDQPNLFWIQVLDLKITKLNQPVMVCTSAKCRELYEINGVKRWHYKQICHSPCYLGGVPKEIVGSPLLASCEAMEGQPLCQKCRCEYQKHMHIYYTTTTFITKLGNVRSESSGTMDQELLLENKKIRIKTIEDRLVEFKNERDIVIKTIAKFVHFLQTNSLVAYNDSYEHYLLYLSDREELAKTYVDNDVLIGQLESMLHRYRDERRILTNASSESNEILPDEILESVNTLYKLKHNGEKIKELLLSQQSARSDEYEAKECVYSENGSPRQQLRNEPCKNTGCNSKKGNSKENLRVRFSASPVNLETDRPQKFQNLEITKKLKIYAEEGKIDVTFNNPPSQSSFVLLKRQIQTFFSSDFNAPGDREK